MHPFPIDTLKDDILKSLDEVDFLVIKSTPGSGKTTRVPLFLSEKYKKKIYILEPRKLAAKLASQFVAKNKGEQPGKSVGHIFKYEKMATDETQVIFLTEGTFLRILASDPTLEDCDVVILDEFHERHYYTDIAFSFLHKIKEKNKNLKVIIMSATINLAELDNALVGRVKTLELNETKHKLHIDHLPNNTLVLKDPLERKVYNALSEVIKRPGHVLIFLPGMYEIRKCEEIVKNNFDCEVVILHSEVAGINIDESFYDLSHKRVILSTNIAESSVTIPGVRSVIDSGLHKISRINPITRLPMVELRKISQSSAVQRANRAGREADGYALRLYAEQDFQGRDLFDVPEINRSDLSELIITSADLFKAPLNDFTFVAPLKETEVKKSEDFLTQIGFLENKLPTPLAHKLSRLPFNPRVSKILYEASLCGSDTYNQVIHFLAELLEPKNTNRFKSLAKNYFRPKDNGEHADLEKIILFGYVDQISKLREGHKLIHSSGEVYAISPSISNNVDPSHELWIILDLDNRNEVTRLLPIEEEWLYDLPLFPIEESERIDFNPETLKLNVERVTHIGAIVLAKEKITNSELSDESIHFVMKKLSPLFKEKLKENTFTRLEILEKYTAAKIADFDFESWFKNQVPYLLSDSNYTLDTVLGFYVNDLFQFLNEEGAYDLEEDLPLFLKLHDKRKVPIHYDATNGIHCESYIQDFYGLKSVPSILKGKEKIKVHLLGPHKRALQVTTDLGSFWDKAYKELYAELKRDYPRHYWPLSPKEALPILLMKNVK